MAVPVLDDHPSSYVVRDFTRALVQLGAEPVPLRRRVGSLLARTGVRVPSFRQDLVIVPMMGPRSDVLAAAALHGRPVPFCWDVWQPQWDTWADILRRAHPPMVMVTAEQSARHLQGRLPSAVVRHLPEATDADRYRAGGRLTARRIDVLELGRRHPAWHDAVVSPARARGLRHLYEPAAGSFVFADEEGLVAGLADTKVSVCFPSDITHPGRSGAVSTLTNRYLESAASRCLVLGHAPEELVDLFGFNPVVEVDTRDPWGQLQSVLASLASYQEQVDRAHAAVRAVGTWSYRAKQLLELVESL